MNIIKNKKNYNIITICFFSQFLKFITIVSCSLIIISIITNNEIKILITNLNALTAILILSFKDIILGFVSGIQIFYTKIIKVGDWISLPRYNIEGIIIEINLISTKLENFDKTIITIPTYDIIATAVINFKVIKKRNIRRIKRSILFNVKSFKFCKKKDLIKFIKKKLIHKNFLKLNKKKYYTNIGIYRIYTINYLRTHLNIFKKEFIMVRNLEQTPYGMPVEIYCFTNTSKLIYYEKIQSEIFDHLFSIAKEFKLEIVQAFPLLI
jgi:miniconductance mechanosensitive channel